MTGLESLIIHAANLGFMSVTHTFEAEDFDPDYLHILYNAGYNVSSFYNIDGTYTVEIRWDIE